MFLWAIHPDHTVQIEDAAVLGSLFSRVTAKSQIPALLKAYETIRYDRATSVQLTALSLQKVFHHADGPEQRERDAAMRRAMDLVLKEARGEAIAKDASFGKNPNAWVDKTKKDALLNYDADEAVDEWSSEHGFDIVGQKELKIKAY
jgi:salicylate hydroxylase